MKQSRLDQLSDGIFAIVMTILVFEIRVPEYMGLVSEQTLINSLLSIYPLLLSYLLSFSLLFTYWRSHHIIASVLAKNIDVQFTNLSGIFLFLVALVPFSSHFLGRYIYSETAIVFFCSIVCLMSFAPSAKYHQSPSATATNKSEIITGILNSLIIIDTV